MAAIVLLSVLVHVFSPVEGSCRNLEITTILKDKALTNHTIRTIQPIINARTCQTKCFLESLCFGVNICVDEKNIATCELTNYIRSERQLVDKPGCTFYGSETACSSEPCQNNATCEGDFEYTPVPYRCICPAGYWGQNCENDCTAVGANDCHENETCSNYQDEGHKLCKCNKKDCYVCNSSGPLGMENGNIPKESITASSMFNERHSPPRARLNIVPNGEFEGSWSAKPSNAFQWLQVNFSSVTVVKGIATQGRQSDIVRQWITSYSLQYSSSGLTFGDYEGGRVFTGNSDRNTIVKHDLLPYIITRYIRVRPKTWHGHISMRMELYGCT